MVPERPPLGPISAWLTFCRGPAFVLHACSCVGFVAALCGVVRVLCGGFGCSECERWACVLCVDLRGHGALRRGAVP